MKSTFGDLSNSSKNKGLNLFYFKTAGFSGPIMNPLLNIPGSFHHLSKPTFLAFIPLTKWVG